MELQMASAPPPIPPESESGPRRFVYWRESRLGRLVVATWARFAQWGREDGYWYLSSTAAHAVGLVCLAMISLALPEVVATSFEKAPAFDEVEMDAAPAEPVVDRFEVGETPLEPSELTTELLSQTKALPIAAQTEKYYDDSPEFKEAGGGTSLDLDAPKLGGLGGLNLKNLPGPGGLGGVGVGLGTGVHAGFGGSGEGYGGRGQGHRKALLGSLGGTKPGERAVAAALNWLYRHQTSQGRWSLDFRRQCRGTICSGPGGARSDAAATGLALLPFLGAGQTHKSKGPYQKCIAKGIAWLIKQQKPDGDLSGGAPLPMYSHGIAAITLCEAYGMTHDEHVGRAARRAVAYIQMAQNRSTGGWRYLPGERGDTSVFGWQMMALKSAQLAGLPVDSMTMENSKKWLKLGGQGRTSGAVFLSALSAGDADDDGRRHVVSAVVRHRSESPIHARRQAMPA